MILFIINIYTGGSDDGVESYVIALYFMYFQGVLLPLMALTKHGIRRAVIRLVCFTKEEHVGSSRSQSVSVQRILSFWSSPISNLFCLYLQRETNERNQGGLEDKNPLEP